MGSLVWPAMVPFENYILNTFCFCVCFSRVSAFFGFCFLNSDGSMGFPLFTHCCSALCTACESSTGWTLYRSPAYPLAYLPLGVPLSFDIQLGRTLFNCIGVFFLSVCGSLRRESVFHWFLLWTTMGPLVFAWPSPLLVLLASLLENFVGISLRGPHAYPPAYFSQGPFFFLLSYGPSSLIRNPFGGNFFVCVGYFLCVWVTGT